MSTLTHARALSRLGIIGLCVTAGCSNDDSDSGRWLGENTLNDAATQRDVMFDTPKSEAQAAVIGHDAAAGSDSAAAVEPCDGVDNNGNGRIDEGCPCSPGQTQACWTGPATARKVGVCKDGAQSCASNGEFGAWGECKGAVAPAKELCKNAVDDDCDGKVDCDDPDCQPCTEADCSDGIDNDKDGLIDCEDPDCLPAPATCGILTGACVTTVTVQSDNETLSASIGWGIGAADTGRLDTPDTSGLDFTPAAAGPFGATISVPAGAPPGTQVINIAPGGGYNGYFKATFSLPTSLSPTTRITLSGAATADDFGRAFLNGHPISPPIGGSPGATLEFCVDDVSLFLPGTNEFLFSDANTGSGCPTDAGPSAAVFYGIVTYCGSVGGH